jgi:hypothetical protein
MTNSTAGSFNMNFPTEDAVNYNPKEISTFYINYFLILYWAL